MPGAQRGRLIRATDLLRALGFRRSLTVLPAWLVLRREFVVVAWPIPPAPQETSHRPSLQGEVLDAGGLPAFRARCPELTEAEIRRRWAAGMECLVLWDEGAIAAYRWDVPAAVGPVRLPYLGRSVRLAPGDVLTYEARTLPARRRLRLGGELVAAAAERARRRGDWRCVGFNAAWNHASLRWAAHLGWVRLGTVGYRRVGVRRHYFATGAISVVGGEIRVPPSAAPRTSPLPGAAP